VPHRFSGAAPDGADALARVIQFRQGLLGPAFFDLPEHATIRALLNRSDLGAALRTASPEVHRLLARLIDTRGARRIALLLETLATLAEHPGWETITGTPLLTGRNSTDVARVRLLQTWIHRHFREDVREADVASELGLTRTSFCRWIRRATGRTFSEILNDHRVTHARLLLMQSDAPVATVAFDAGFGSVSHFYREFRRRSDLSASAVRRRAHGRRVAGER
jgi:AraC-like DNA-binding protein